MRSFRSLMTVSVSAVLTFVSADGTAGQVVQVDTTGQGWTVASIAHADLWFHGIAIVGLQGIGPLPLYDPDYVTGITAEKQRRGVYPTKLDEIGAELAQELSRVELTQSFVHFVPLYFPDASREEMFGDLRDVAANRWDRQRARGGIHRGLLVMSQVFSQRRDRRALSKLLDALDEEWDLFYRDYWNEQVTVRLPQIQTIQTAWDRHFEPKLRPFLEEHEFGYGVMAVSPSLGFEGRVTDGGPFSVAVAVPVLDTPQPAGLAPFFLVKELCYLMLDDVTEQLDDSDEDRFERMRSVLAIRCGEILLEHYMPEATDAYVDTFLLPFAADSAVLPEFEELYQLDEEILDRLRTELTGRSN